MLDTVYTIGHSNHSIEHLIALLEQHGITALGDVRSTPYSRYNPHFDREALKGSLEAAGISYVYLGRELGARSDDPACYLQGKIQFRRLAETAIFRKGLERIADGIKTFRIAIMCAEKEPLDCHRTILVARELEMRGIPVTHIHANGELESQANVLVRLARLLNLRESEDHLFRTRENLFDDAYALQEQRIGYEIETPAEPALP